MSAGLLRVLSNDQLVAQERAEADARSPSTDPVVQGLAMHVQKCFSAARTAKQMHHEEDLLRALRMRNAEYDPEVKEAIRQIPGGSDIYSRVGATKMRGAQSWLKDIYLQIERPFTIKPSPEPSLPQDVGARVDQMIAQMVEQGMAAGLPAPHPSELEGLHAQLLKQAKEAARQEAQNKAEAAERAVDDILVEGHFYTALEECISDITTFKACILKGPVVRNRKRVKWTDDPATGKTVPQVQDQLTYVFERVSPFNIYPAPMAATVTDSYVIERHKLTRGDLASMIGSPGFDEAQIRAALAQYGQTGLSSYQSVDSAEASALGNQSPMGSADPHPTIEALEFWGRIQGQMLIDFGMDPEGLDPDLEYPANVWVVGPYTIKALLNHDPLARVPYSVTSWEKLPGSFWGVGLGEQLRDVQAVCNASVRALMNNMSLASGPQIMINKDRMAAGEDIRQIFPLRSWVVQSGDFGSADSRPPVEFYQPSSNAAELVGVFDKFSVLADEFSSLPRYMMGDQHVGGAGRTAAGLSMLMNAANKGIKNVANNIDTDIIVPTIERLYYSLMLYGEDESIKGDAFIQAKGASGLLLKELLNQRRLEFLQIALPAIQSQLVPPTLLVNVLHELAKGLEFAPGTVPSVEEFQAHMAQMQQMQGQLEGMKTGQGQENQPPKPEMPQTPAQEAQQMVSGPAT
jgi:hypothetical protein